MVNTFIVKITETSLDEKYKLSNKCRRMRLGNRKYILEIKNNYLRNNIIVIFNSILNACR